MEIEKSDYVHTMSAHFGNGGRCDYSKILACVQAIPTQYEHDRKFVGIKLAAASRAI